MHASPLGISKQISNYHSHYRRQSAINDTSCNIFIVEFKTNLIPQSFIGRSILTLIPLGYSEDLSPLGGGLFWPPPPQISATNGPIDLKIGTVVKQVK